MIESQEHNHSLDYYNGTPWFVYECTIELNTDNRRVALFLLYLFIFIAGLLENLLVLWVNWRRRHSANGVLFCLLNVSMSDLMVILILPFYMLEVTINQVWLWGRFLCKVTSLVYSVNLYSSSFFLALMTLERYLSLSKPTFPSIFPVNRRRRWWLCAAVWLFSFFLALLENVHVDLLEWDDPGCYMLPEQNFMEWFVSTTIVSLVFQFLIPGTIIITCNYLLAKAVRNAPDVQDKRDVWLVHVYSVVFVVCWFPFHLILFLLMIDDINPFLFSCNTVEVMYFTYSIVQTFSLLHCVANPILYNFLSKSFRSNLISRVVSYIPKEGNVEGQMGGGTQPNGGGGGTEGGKQRKISNASTSQSDVGS
ncbi:G-protein coupled receptor 182 [Boleophthalmus pectinirostris]|uniref:G-protein coupled receptor 182 n=1 Tax=Boleophthalmus pectinirostris TaxID=150288 RepID=UPI000A1C1BD9|nr:G-protein coupled receptor 182 [Boleophthalmus pectinirostris]